jgi:hypothetical protein
VGLYPRKQIRNARQRNVRDDGKQRFTPLPAIQGQKHPGLRYDLLLSSPDQGVVAGGGKGMQENGRIAAAMGNNVDVGVGIALQAQLHAITGAQHTTVTD